MSIASGSPALAADLLKSHNAAGELELAGSTELTISSGAVVATQNFHRIDTEADAASDTLDTITLASDMDDGYLLIVRAENAGRTVTISHNTGNILCAGSEDIILDDIFEFAVLLYDGNQSKWLAEHAVTVEDLSVTTSKIAANAVDDTKVGDRVPQFYRRQGGSATAWATTGTTDRTPTTVRMQAGVITTGILNPAGIDVTFPTAFSDTPIVFVTPADDADASVRATVNGVTASGFSVWTSEISQVVNWLAIGPE